MVEFNLANDDRVGLEDASNVWQNFLQYSSTKSIQFLHPFLTPSVLSKNSINVYDISNNIFVLGNEGVGKKKIINGILSSHIDISSSTQSTTEANTTANTSSNSLGFVESLSYSSFKITSPTISSHPTSLQTSTKSLTLQFNSSLTTRANLYGVDQRLSSSFVSDIIGPSLSRGDNLAAILVVDLSSPDDALLSAKEWLLRLNSLLLQHPNFSSKSEDKIDRNEDKLTEVIKKMNRHYLLSARVHKGSYNKVLNEILDTSENVSSPNDLFYKILDDPQADKSPNSPLYLSSKFFPIPILIIGSNLDRVSQSDTVLLKKVNEAKAKLRLLSHAVGASFLCGNDNENVYYFAKIYLIHRLFPHIVSLQTLKLFEDKKDFLFIPSGFESVDLVERSSGIEGLKLDFNELFDYFSSTSLDSLTKYKSVFNSQLDLSDTPFEEIESEQSWLEGLYSHIKSLEKKTSKSISGVSEASSLTVQAEDDKNVKSPPGASSTPTSSNRRPNITASGTKDVKNFFTNLVKKKEKE